MQRQLTRYPATLSMMTLLALALACTPKGGGGAAAPEQQQGQQPADDGAAQSDGSDGEDGTAQNDDGDGDGDGDGGQPTIVTNVANAVVTLPPEQLVVPGSLNLMPVDLPEDGAGLRLTATDLDKATVSVWAWDPAMDPLKQASYVLCLISETDYNLHTNLPAPGAYTARVAFDACEDQSGGQGGTAGGLNEGGGTEAKTADLVVLSSKQGTAPLIAKFSGLIPQSKFSGMHTYVPPGETPPQARLYVHLMVAAPASDINPYGSFIASYAIHNIVDGNEVAAAATSGTIEIQQDADTGSPHLTYFQGSTRTDTWGLDSWTTTLSKAATASLTVTASADGKDFRVAKGAAKTSEQWGWSYTSGGNAENATYAGQSNSGHYTLAFDELDRATKYTPADDNGMNWPESAQVPTCQTRAPRLIAGNYTPYKSNGSRLSFSTFLSIEGSGETEWGYPRFGYQGFGGAAWMPGPVVAGEAVKVHKGDDVIDATFHPLQGTLYDTGMNYAHVTFTEPSATFYCDNNCIDADGATLDTSMGQVIQYTWDDTTYTLKYQGNAVEPLPGEGGYTWASLALRDLGSTRTLTFNMSRNSWGAEGYVKRGNGTIMVPDAPLRFSERAIAADDFAGEPDADLVGQNFFAALTWGGTPESAEYYGYWYNPIKSTELDETDQFGNKTWGPIADVGRFTLQAANATSDIAIGDDIIFNPEMFWAMPKFKPYADCADGVKSDLAAAEGFTLLNAVPSDRANVPAAVGALPANAPLLIE